MASVGQQRLLTPLLLVSEGFPRAQEPVLRVLQALAPSPHFIEEACAKGVVLYLLVCFATHPNAELREAAAAAYIKMVGDKLHGPRVLRQMHHFLPPIFTEAMRESTATAIAMFDSSQETPELLWTEDVRAQVIQRARRMKEELVAQQREDSDAVWQVPSRGLSRGGDGSQAAGTGVASAARDRSRPGSRADVAWRLRRLRCGGVGEAERPLPRIFGRPGQLALVAPGRDPARPAPSGVASWSSVDHHSPGSHSMRPGIEPAMCGLKGKRPTSDTLCSNAHPAVCAGLA